MVELPSSREDEKADGIQVIARAAKILNALGKHPGGMSLGEIAQVVDLPRSTVQRIVAALARTSGTQLAIVHYVVATRELRVVPRIGLNLPLCSTALLVDARCWS